MVRLEFETFMQVQMNKREGLSRWVSRELQGPLTSHTWFLTSSSQLVAEIRTVVVDDCDYFVKLDVRDFYMPSWSQVQVVVRSC